MNWFSGTLVYIVIWWLVLFMVLPFGVKRTENVEAGHDSGASSSATISVTVLCQNRKPRTYVAGFCRLGLHKNDREGDKPKKKQDPKDLAKMLFL